MADKIDWDQIITIMEDPLRGSAISAAFWTVLYQALYFLPGFGKKPFAFTNRFLAILHAVVAISLTLPLCILMTGIKDIDADNTKAQELVLNVSMGYFSFDTISWLWNGVASNKMDWGQIAHHLSVLISFGCAYFYHHSAGVCVVGLFLAESANPFMYARYLLWCLDLGNSSIARINMHIFMLTLTLSIPVATPFVVYGLVTSPRAVAFHKIGGVVLFVLNIYWFTLFLQKYIKNERAASPPRYKRSRTALEKQQHTVFRSQLSSSPDFDDFDDDDDDDDKKKKKKK